MQSTRKGTSALYRVFGDALTCSLRSQFKAFGGSQRRHCAAEAKKLPPGAGTSDSSRRLFQKVLDGAIFLLTRVLKHQSARAAG